MREVKNRKVLTTVSIRMILLFLFILFFLFSLLFLFIQSISPINLVSRVQKRQKIQKTQKIAVFNLKETHSLFLKQVFKKLSLRSSLKTFLNASTHSLSKKEVESLVKMFPQALEKAVSTYARKNHVVIFTKSAVISGGVNITKDIQQQIAKNMQQMMNGSKKGSYIGFNKNYNTSLNNKFNKDIRKSIGKTSEKLSVKKSREEYSGKQPPVETTNRLRKETKRIGAIYD